MFRVQRRLNESWEAMHTFQDKDEAIRDAVECKAARPTALIRVVDEANNVIWPADESAPPINPLGNRFGQRRYGGGERP